MRDGFVSFHVQSLLDRFDLWIIYSASAVFSPKFTWSFWSLRYQCCLAFSVFCQMLNTVTQRELTLHRQHRWFVPFLRIFQSLLHQLAVWSGSSRLVIIVAIATVFRVQSIISLSGIQFCFLVLFFSHAKFEWLFTEESQLLQPCFSRQEEKKSHLLNMTHARSIIVYTAVLFFWLLWFREW